MDIRDFMDDEDSDTEGDSGIGVGNGNGMWDRIRERLEQIEAGGDNGGDDGGDVTGRCGCGSPTATTSTTDINSVDSLPKPEAQKKVHSFGVVMEAETPMLDIDKIRDTKDALKDRPESGRCFNKRSYQKSSAEDSEDPLSVRPIKKRKLKMAMSTLEEEAMRNAEEEKESGCEDFSQSHNVKMCGHQIRWNSCQVSIHPIDSPSNPWVNPAWLHTELIKIYKRKVTEEKQRAGEYSKMNREAAEKISELQQIFKDQADTIEAMKAAMQ